MPFSLPQGWDDLVIEPLIALVYFEAQDFVSLEAPETSSYQNWEDFCSSQVHKSEKCTKLLAHVC